ncbi:MAG: phosphotransferase-like protein [Ktedonobacterales bacterium]
MLNGISSAGKTSISKVLQQTMNDPYLQVSIDAFEDMLPDRYQEAGAFAWEEIFPKLLAGFHRSIAALLQPSLVSVRCHASPSRRRRWSSGERVLAPCRSRLTREGFCPPQAMPFQRQW